MDANLPDGIYFFIDQGLPLAELAMIEVPLDLETLLRTKAAANGTDLIRREPVELTCQSGAYGDATFLFYKTHEQDRLHMLAPKRFSTGTADAWLADRGAASVALHREATAIDP